MTICRSSRDENGSVAPLIIGFAVVVAMLVAVVVDASAAYLRRQGLNSAADAAALAATDGIQGEQVYTHGLGKRAEIDPAVLVEGGFLTNKEDISKLASEDYREEIAAAVSDGILRYRDAVKQRQSTIAVTNAEQP